MLNRILQTIGLTSYKALVKSGALSNPVARRGFLKAYGLYKSLIEAGPIDMLKAYVVPGSTVVDIGANVGFFTLKFADWVGPSGKVLAVEPDSENYSALVRALASLSLGKRVLTHRAVAAEAPGILKLHRNEIHPGDHKIAIGREEGIEVNALTIDSLVGEGPTGAVSLIKIDVQGAEMKVLQGATGVLAAHNPALFIEVDDRALKRFGSSAEHVVSFLEGRGYHMHQLVKNDVARPLDRATLRQTLAKKAYVDVLFLQPGLTVVPRSD